MKLLALLATLSLLSGCAPMSGLSGISAISSASYKSMEADTLSDRGEAFLLMKLDSRYEKKTSPKE